ncbi:MAG: endonuclease/exonuclease/phosphatase family protein [Bacteroidetes bacterium]|nr:endonuclease/exonuclease/phosphatase family protein [Bacteroidota bacterium]
MAGRFRQFARRFFIFTNIVVALFFLMACFFPSFKFLYGWLSPLLALSFPFLLLAVLLFFFWWLIVKWKLAGISLIALLFGWKSITVFLAFHPGQHFSATKEKNSIRIATWNVARFIEMKRNNNKGSQTRLKMMEQIKEQNADIICMQEFFHSLDSSYYQNINYISENLHYPYWYYSYNNDGYRHFFGCIIFSRYPIIDSGLVVFPKPTLPETVMHADIKVNNDTIRVYTTHLQSVQLGKSDYEKIDEIKKAEDSLVSNSRTIFSKLKRSSGYRRIQADIVKEQIANSPYPLIFCGDMNDVPNSYTYAAIRGNLQDAFLQKGFGIGRTFNALSPTLRIDYILPSDEFGIIQFKRIVKNYSDHYMLVADVKLKK